MGFLQMVIMAINGSDFIDHPWNTTFKAFTDLLGMGFYIVPVSFISLALYVKTRNPVLVSAFMWGSGLMLTSGAIFAEYPEMALVYGIFTAIGVAGVFISLFFMRK
jgi:hypothetical protein